MKFGSVNSNRFSEIWVAYVKLIRLQSALIDFMQLFHFAVILVSVSLFFF